MSDLGDFREEPVDITGNGHVDVVAGEFKHELEEVASFRKIICRLKEKPVHGHATANQKFNGTNEEVVEFSTIEIADASLSFFIDASV